MKTRLFLASILALSTSTTCRADEKIRLARQPNLAPNGRTLLFVHDGDIWKVATKGGSATRLTSHDANDEQPLYSPDGKRIAFISARSGSNQVWVMPAGGGEPKQLTFHSEGCSLQSWYPDGKNLLVLGSRDHHWRSSSRFMKISSSKRSAEKLLFDGYGSEGKVSPDGKSILFVREGERWWRKGYTGARSAQIWLYSTESAEFTKLVDTPAGNRSPVWLADGRTFVYCSSDGADNGARNLWQYNLKTEKKKQLTQFDDDLVTTPTVSADGSTVVFSHLFDLYSFSLNGNEQPARINIRRKTDDTPADSHRRILKTATDAAFSSDGLEIAMIAGGDLWVMETELKEPVRITRTEEFESDPIFADDGNSILFVGWKNGQADIWKVERADESQYWWQSSQFTMTQITSDADLESDLTLSPDGSDLFYIRGRGDLWVRNLDSGENRQLVDAFSSPGYDVSPDGKWIVYSQTDNDFNNDIWIAPVDGSADPVNVSRHPDDEAGPKWSPDGKMIAFSGRRSDDEVDIYYLYLTEEDDDTDSRDRKLKKTLEALKKSRSESKPTAATSGTEADGKQSDEKSSDEKQKEDKKADDGDDNEKAAESKRQEVKIDFANIHRRLRRISIANGREWILGWTPDSKKLLFSGTVKGDSGTWSVTFPDELTPKKFSGSTGQIKGWLRKPDRLLWLVNGVPTMRPLTGEGSSYAFSAYQELSRSARYRAGFDAAWRIMRDAWYDDNFGNHNWDEVRRKYSKSAEHARNATDFARVISLMLGELNGSHLGFYPAADPGTASGAGDEWRPTTAHLGVRFDGSFRGPGLRVRDVIPNGPATDAASLIHAGETILSIDGTAVDPDLDLTTVLNGRIDRDIKLRVRAAGKKGGERDVVLRPSSFSRMRSQLYQKWQDDNRSAVGKRAANIGYLHIQGMNWPSFLDFERELYDVGYGKDGLIIDVRDNGGGFTTDHLLTALTQPEHAITVPRGGGPGYPQSRKVYASWNKPIVVLCNQNSYSNAEIFSHAIRQLGRGRLVGVPTAGGVISTGAASVMDLGRIRVPFRGWFVKETGEDMELNGAVPHVIVWPRPTEIPGGKDRQLLKAVKVLQKDIATWKSREQPQLRKATERD